MTSATDYGLPVPTAIDATLAWVNGNVGADVFRRVDSVLGPLDLPLLSIYQAPEAHREQAREWLKAIGRAVAKNRAKARRGKKVAKKTGDYQPPAVAPRALPKVRREVAIKVRSLTVVFSIQPRMTMRGIQYGVAPTGFVKSEPLTWAALAAAELMTNPDTYHFLMCPGCERFSVDIREGRGKRRGRFCSKRCQDRVGQREWRLTHPKLKLRAGLSANAKPRTVAARVFHGELPPKSRRRE